MAVGEGRGDRARVGEELGLIGASETGWIRRDRPDLRPDGDGGIGEVTPVRMRPEILMEVQGATHAVQDLALGRVRGGVPLRRIWERTCVGDRTEGIGDPHCGWIDGTRTVEQPCCADHGEVHVLLIEGDAFREFGPGCGSIANRGLAVVGIVAVPSSGIGEAIERIVGFTHCAEVAPRAGENVDREGFEADVRSLVRWAGQCLRDPFVDRLLR